MTKKQLLYLVVLLVLVGAAGALVLTMRHKSWNSSTAEGGQQVLPDLDVNLVHAVHIADSANQVDLVKREKRWQVEQRYGYPADFKKVSDLVLALNDLKATQEVRAEKSQYARLELLPPEDGDTNAGTRIELRDAQNTVLASLILGKHHMQSADSAGGMMGGSWPVGRYVLVELPSPERVLRVAETLSEARTDTKAWLDKTFIKITDVRSASLQRQGEAVWHLVREADGEKLILADLGEEEQLQESMVSNVSNAFSWSSFEDIANPQLTEETTGLADPTVFEAESADGILTRLEIGTKNDAGNYYVTTQLQYAGPAERTAGESESEAERQQKDEEFNRNMQTAKEKVQEMNELLSNWVYLLPGHTVERVLKSRSDFLKPPEEPADEEADTAADPGHQAPPDQDAEEQ